ncbi:hypothetical protein CRG98_021347 [Punica granatum]|uniref:Uncharacterized protein n=1 Tax=Punica granatum TaxID=22663 RepID=A0A2I0JPP3_PUNGR|nr:hypothetical protein CRG98_021347 [Punica granatum]
MVASNEPRGTHRNQPISGKGRSRWPWMNQGGSRIPSSGISQEYYLASEHEERVGEVAKGVGRLGWNEQTRTGAVGSTGRPDWQSGLSGLYRLIGMEFSHWASFVGFPRD